MRPEWSHPNRLLPMSVNILGFYASALLFARIFENLRMARREADARRMELDRIRALHADVIASMSSGLATIDPVRRSHDVESGRRVDPALRA